LNKNYFSFFFAKDLRKLPLKRAKCDWPHVKPLQAALKVPSTVDLKSMR